MNLSPQSSDEQYMRELYLRFRKNVEENDNSEFYEQDELLDIYDYAQDEADDMIMLHVFLAGARLYPDSPFLDERKAFFLSAINDQAARRMFDRKGRKESALWGVLDLSLKNYPDGNPEDDLTELLASGRRFSCEAIIRLLDTLHDLGRDDLIAENIHILEERTDYPMFLYYEACETLSNNDQYLPTALHLAEELTKQEPFNIDNWVMLARIEFALEHADEAMAAADYALAIDPASPQARLIKGISMVPSKAHRAQAIEILSKIVSETPENSVAVKALAEAYRRDRKKQAATEVYLHYMEQNEANSFVIMDILKLHPSNPAPYLEVYDRYTGSNERRWLEVAGQLFNEREHLAAYEMLTFYHARHSLREGMEYYLRVLYTLRKFDTYRDLFQDICEQAVKAGAFNYELSPYSYLLLASCYLLTGCYDEAEQLTSTLISHPMPIPTDDLPEHTKWKGMLATLQYIRELAVNPRLIPSSPTFDPITHPYIPLPPKLQTPESPRPEAEA